MSDIRRSRRIPDDKRELFKEPIGKLINENDLKELGNGLIAVGDVVSMTANNNGIIPKVCIYDGMTERKEMTEFASFVENKGWETTVINNPAGTITSDLAEAVENALSGTERKMIRVVGEVIPCILLSPEGTNIIYGWPGKGMKLVVTDEDIRKKARYLMEMTEELE